VTLNRRDMVDGSTADAQGLDQMVTAGGYNAAHPLLRWAVEGDLPRTL